MPASTILFHFDFLSPYAYLAHHRIGPIAAGLGLGLDYRPVDLAWIKQAAGNTGPATREMPLKLAYARTDLQRWARDYNVSLIPLKSYASGPLNKGTFYAADRGVAADYVTATWARIYGEGQDMSDPGVVSGIAGSLGWDAEEFAAFISSDEAEARLKQANDDAHAAGVFGVPTMIAGDDMWWGNDRLELMVKQLDTVRSG